MIQMPPEGAHDLYHNRKSPSTTLKIGYNTCSQPMYATIESEARGLLIRTLTDNIYQSYKY